MYQSVEDTFQYLPHLPQNLSLYEFGVYSGNTLIRLINGAKQAGLNFNAVYGFDSFEGLPEEAAGIKPNDDWKPGVFDAREWYKVDSKKAVMDIIHGKLDETLPKETPRKLLCGWFKDTCSKFNLHEHKMGPCSYLHIDTDLYISAYQALEFMCENNLVVPGTLIRYDDWCSTPEWTAGQSLAHSQIMGRFGIDCLRISTNVFVVQKLNG